MTPLQKLQESSQHQPKLQKQVFEASEQGTKPEALLGKWARWASISTVEGGWKARDQPALVDQAVGLLGGCTLSDSVGRFARVAFQRIHLRVLFVCFCEFFNIKILSIV